MYITRFGNKCREISAPDNGNDILFYIYSCSQKQSFDRIELLGKNIE